MKSSLRHLRSFLVLQSSAPHKRTTRIRNPVRSARCPSRRVAIRRCRRSSSAPWRCCIRSGIRRARRRSATCSRTIRSARSPLGNRVDPDVESAGRAGRVAEGRRAGAGGDRRGTPHRREDRARARLHRSGRRLLQGLRDALREGAAGLARARPTRRWRRSTRTTTRRRSSPRSTSPARRRRPTRPTRRISRRPPSSRTQFKKYPDHPGVAHYLIHSYDAPPIADKGLAAARRYASIAPAAPHALHMPSHIFTRVGAWQESAATNLRSREVAKAGNEPDEAYHASDYMVYAYLQLARDAEARRSIDEAMKVTGTSTRFVAPYAIAAMPARYAFERGAWEEAAKLQPIGSTYPFVEAITYFARSVGAARSGDLAAAAQGCRAARNAPQGAARREEHLLGHRGRGPAARRGRLDRAGRRQDRRGAQVHARGGRPRGQEREAHRHAGPHRSRARAAGRHAARAEATRAALEGVRSVAAARAQPLPQLPRFARAPRKWRATGRRPPPTTRSSWRSRRMPTRARPELASAKKLASR